MNKRSIKKDIAIIGMSGNFPESDNLIAFWKHLVEGNELLHFYSDTELKQLGASDEQLKNKNYVKVNSLLKDEGNFDHSFFGYTQEEAALMDPQLRLLHQQAWLSLEDAGYNPFNYSDKIGCFLSASDNINWRTHVTLSSSQNVNPFFVKHLSNSNSVSRLVSYSLNLKGPSYFIDTACSSSLVATHMACRALLLKECTMALAGGASISSTTDVGYVYEEGSILSKDGHCRAFDSESSGVISGQGAATVVLKRLEDALKDGDYIYCVIRASSVNNDGNRKVGYTAPSIIGQYECIKAAHQMAEVDPKQISYVEAHGTGTKLGDPIEIEALNKAFNYDTSHQCAIGSLKTNLGHLDAAAGIASLIKTALALKNKVLPPSLNFKVPNPEINFKAGPFYVNSTSTEWLSETARLAGVSSFGIGGTNAHVLLEEAPAPIETSPPKAYQLLVYSAKTKTSIKNYQHNLENFLKANEEINLADLAFTLKARRNRFKYRNFILCKSTDDAIIQLNKISANEPFQTKEKKGIVFLFSGQGSQYYEMGKQIYWHYPFFKSCMDKGFEILKRETGEDYAAIIGYNDVEKPDNDLINDTRYTQPLLFLLEYAFAKLLLELGITPSNMIGHSLGEYVAACISEVFSFEDGLKLIVKRAQLMSDLERGSMLSVDLPMNQVTAFISPSLSIAAINTETSCVISGSTSDIDAVAELFSAKEIPFSKLKTSHAFHSQMMNPILKDYEVVLNKINFNEPKYPFISCTTGLPIEKEEAVSPKYWVKHLKETVNFCKGLDTLLREGYGTYIEIGSSKTLLTFVRQNKNYSSDLNFVTVLKHPKETKDDSYYLLSALGSLWACGVEVDWNKYYLNEVRNKLQAPGYSFDKILFPSRVNPIKKFIELNASLLQSEMMKEDGNVQVSALHKFIPNATLEIQDTNQVEKNRYTEAPPVNAAFKNAQSETEKALCELWKELFGYDEIGVNDDFFELGGDSLKASVLLKRIHKAFDIEIGIADFFRKSNIEELGKEIELALEVKELKKPESQAVSSKQIRL